MRKAVKLLQRKLRGENTTKSATKSTAGGTRSSGDGRRGGGWGGSGRPAAGGAGRGGLGQQRKFENASGAEQPGGWATQSERGGRSKGNRKANANRKHKRRLLRQLL